MAKRRRPQPRDNHGRFTSTKTPLWFILLIVVVVLIALAL